MWNKISIFIYLNKADVYNVSIARVRSKQHVFCSISLNKLNAEHVFGQYISSIRETTANATHLTTYIVEDKFVEEVVDVIKSFGIETIYKSYPLGGIGADLDMVHEG